MLPKYCEIAKLIPNRKLSWRYERVQYIMTHNQCRWHRYRDDELTKRSVRYMMNRLHKMTVDVDPMTRQSLLMDHTRGADWGKYSDIHQAYESFTMPQTNLSRDILEARILSGQSPREIAKHCSMTPESVVAYEQLFYNVSDRLDKSDYIVANALGPVFQSGLGTYNPACMMKYFAYFAGPRILNIILTGFTQRRKIETDDEVIGFLNSQIESNWLVQSATMSTALQPGRFDVRSIIEGYTQMKTLEVRQVAAPEQSAWVTSLVSYLANRCPTPRGSEAQKLVGTPIANYAAGSVELRASEQLQRASKNGLPYLANLEQFKIPEPEVPAQEQTNK